MDCLRRIFALWCRPITPQPREFAVTRFSLASAAVVASAIVALPAGNAQARIACDGNYQIVQGRHISTPYCRDQNLARVARGYGMRVSDGAIRNSESVKGQVCRTIGHDLRVREVCQPYRDFDGPSLRW